MCFQRSFGTFLYTLLYTGDQLREKTWSSEMFLQDMDNASLMQLPPFFAQSSITLQHKLGERMNAHRWAFQPKPTMLMGVKVELVNRDLWQQFHEQNTEMIITKSGRRMFPSIQINVSGLQRRDNYCIAMEITAASKHRHKYCGYDNENKSAANMGGWSVAGPAEPQHPFERRIYVHPDSPATGEHWLNSAISFNKLKLTNNINDRHTNVVLTSMHKYVPKIWIIRCNTFDHIYNLFSHPAASFTFKETEFIAVTAYQNENITKLKIDNNPFAKGFRVTGQSRFKRKYNQTDQQSQLGSSHTNDEGDSVSFYDSESSRIEASERSNSESNLESSTQESSKRLAVESNADNDEQRVPTGPANLRVPIPANLRSPLTNGNDENEMRFHRPWLDFSPKQVPEVTLTPSTYYNSDYPSDIYSWYMNNYRRFYEYQCQLHNYYSSTLGHSNYYP
ncbi:T-box transcription factor TBX3 [Solenopsis invicta]|uniref:T-box transcription factor TBX3 n=1 Tax=Solenopsis invicta TaxID=13686 RepID=UPI00193E0AC8|nr:T-box transcription factor TBX3 [Solenopsis invicta]